MLKSIKNTLILQLGLVIIFVNVAIGLFFYVFTVKLTDLEFRENSAIQTKHLADAFSQQLWLFDLNAARNLADLAVNSPNIVGLKVSDHHRKEIVDVGEFSQPKTIKVKEVLRHKDGMVVGYVELGFVNAFREREKNVIVLSGLMAGVMTFIVTFFFIIFLLNRHLVRPLNTLQADMDHLAEGNFKQSQLTGYKSEIQRIINVFNAMAVSLAEREKSRLEAEQKLKESQERFLSLFTSSKDSIFTINRYGKVLDINPAMLTLLGYSKDEILRINISSIFRNEGDQHALISKVENTGAIVDYKIDLYSKNGSVKQCLLTGTLWTDDDGTILGYHGIIRDITEQKKLEAQLNQAQKMEAIGTLAGGIAHDFNNILSVIVGYADLAIDDVDQNSPITEDLQQILKAGERAKELVKQILVFSRQTEIKQIPIQLQSLIKEVLKMVRSSLPSTIEIRDTLHSDCGVVLVDPTQMQQIIMNLCTNAAHAMERTGGILQIGLDQREFDLEHQLGGQALNPGKYIELTVSDTGSGIAPEYLERVFDPYFTTKEPGKGTGMGLAIIHGIVAQSGGRITVESEVGKGSVFHVFLPVVEQPQQKISDKVKEIPLGTERILLVDDEVPLTDLGTYMLQRLGYSVTVRNSSLEALTFFQNDPEAFDVVITDQTMPGMTGIDLSRRILQIRPDMPIILCTGYSNLVDEKSARAHGIKAFALKPLTRSMIAHLLREVLAGRV